MESRHLFKQVRELNLPLGKYALFGSAPLGIRGMRECHDIDIITMEDVWEVYKYKEGWKVKKLIENENVEYIRKDSIELYKNWGPGEWDVEKLIRESEIIEGLPFVKLEQVLRWKKLNRRGKDLKDLEIIQKFPR